MKLPRLFRKRKPDREYADPSTDPVLEFLRTRIRWHLNTIEFANFGTSLRPSDQYDDAINEAKAALAYLRPLFEQRQQELRYKGDPRRFYDELEPTP